VLTHLVAAPIGIVRAPGWPAGNGLSVGAQVLWRKDFTTHHWTGLADPEGNEFCAGLFG